YGVVGDAAGGAQIGLPGSPNRISGNGVNTANLYPSDIMLARYNYWGAVAEDSIAAGLAGSVAYSPWYNAAASATYVGARCGALAGNPTWSGTVWLRGDLIVPGGITLRIMPGTTVRAWSRRTASDDPSGTPFRPDIIVYGRIAIGDVSGARARLT